MHIESFAKNLKYFRKHAGFTQEELAEKANISYSFYVKLENSNNLPGWDTLFSICDVLNVPIEFLIRDSDHREFAQYANYWMVKEMEKLSDIEFKLISKNIELLYLFCQNAEQEKNRKQDE